MYSLANWGSPQTSPRYKQGAYQPRRRSSAAVHAGWEFVQYSVESSGFLRNELFDSCQTAWKIGWEDPPEIFCNRVFIDPFACTSGGWGRGTAGVEFSSRSLDGSSHPVDRHRATLEERLSKATAGPPFPAGSRVYCLLRKPSNGSSCLPDYY